MNVLLVAAILWGGLALLSIFTFFRAVERPPISEEERFFRTLPNRTYQETNATPGCLVLLSALSGIFAILFALVGIISRDPFWRLFGWFGIVFALIGIILELAMIRLWAIQWEEFKK